MPSEILPSPLWNFGPEYEAPPYRNALNQYQALILPSCNFQLPTSDTDVLKVVAGLMEQNRILRMDVEKCCERINELESEKLSVEDFTTVVEKEVESVVDAQVQTYLKELTSQVQEDVVYMIDQRVESHSANVLNDSLQQVIRSLRI